MRPAPWPGPAYRATVITAPPPIAAAPRCFQAGMSTRNVDRGAALPGADRGDGACHRARAAGPARAEFCNLGNCEVIKTRRGRGVAGTWAHWQVAMAYDAPSSRYGTAREGTAIRHIARRASLPECIAERGPKADTRRPDSIARTRHLPRTSHLIDNLPRTRQAGQTESILDQEIHLHSILAARRPPPARAGSSSAAHGTQLAHRGTTSRRSARSSCLDRDADSRLLQSNEHGRDWSKQAA